MANPREEYLCQFWLRTSSYGVSGEAVATMSLLGEAWCGVSPGGSAFRHWDPGLEVNYEYVFNIRNTPRNQAVLPLLGSPENLYIHITDARCAYYDLIAKVERKRIASCFSAHRDYHEVFFGNHVSPTDREVYMQLGVMAPKP